MVVLVAIHYIDPSYLREDRDLRSTSTAGFAHGLGNLNDCQTTANIFCSWNRDHIPDWNKGATGVPVQVPVPRYGPRLEYVLTD